MNVAEQYSPLIFTPDTNDPTAALSATPVLTWMGGVLGLVAAGIAWYLCLAGVTASTSGRPILPNPPLFKS